MRKLKELRLAVMFLDDASWNLELSRLQQPNSGSLSGRLGKMMRIRGAKIFQNLMCWVLECLGYLRARGIRLERFRFNRVDELAPSTAEYTPVVILAGGRLSRGPTLSIRRSDL